MDTSDPLITFDDKGICNHCIEFDLKAPEFMKNNESGKKELEKIISKIKLDGKNRDYDCIIGLSGGIDSSFLALKVKKFGLRPLVVHVDAGWNSELAVNNIQTIIEHCEFDLFTDVVDWATMKKLQLAFLHSGISNQDVPQDHVFFASLYHFAIKNKIKYILSGGNFATESVLPSAWKGSAMDSLNLKSIYKFHMGENLKNYKIINFFQYYILFPFFYGMRTLRPLNFIDYDKNEALNELKQIGFKPYKGKHGESLFTKFYQDYYLPKKFGYDMRLPHLSSLILSKQITREEGIERLKELNFNSSEMILLKSYVAKKLEISESQLEDFIKVPNREYSEYPNWLKYQKIILKINELHKKLFRKKIRIYS